MIEGEYNEGSKVRWYKDWKKKKKGYKKERKEGKREDTKKER